MTWAGEPAVLQQLHLNPWSPRPARPTRSSCSGRPSAQLLLPGLPVADVHGGDLGHDVVLRAVVTGPERSFDQDPLLAFRLLADIALRALSRRSTTRPPPSRRSTAWKACSVCSPPGRRADQLADDAGVVRVILRLPRWDDFARSASTT